MIGKNWKMTHPFGKNRIWRTLLWGLQRFWRGWDETMPDQVLPWTLEFIQVVCDETSRYQIVGVNGFSSEEWKDELAKGKRLAKAASHAYWNEWEELDIDIQDPIEEEKERSRIIRKALKWWYENLAEDRFEQW